MRFTTPKLRVAVYRSDVCGCTKDAYSCENTLFSQGKIKNSFSLFSRGTIHLRVTLEDWIVLDSKTRDSVTTVVSATAD